MWENVNEFQLDLNITFKCKFEFLPVFGHTVSVEKDSRTLELIPATILFGRVCPENTLRQTETSHQSR